MTEPVPEALPPRTTYEPPDPEAALARKNLLFGLALLGLFLLLFAGIVLVAVIYLALD